MRIKHIFNVYALIMDKRKTPELPDNTVMHSTHVDIKYLDDYFKPFVNIDFSRQKLLIVYTDPNRKKIKCDAMFQVLENILEVTKEQIKSKTRKEEIVFARQLFQYGFMKSKLGTLSTAGKETRNDHSSVHHSLEVIENCIEVGNGWRKKVCSEFIKELKL